MTIIFAGDGLGEVSGQDGPAHPPPPRPASCLGSQITQVVVTSILIPILTLSSRWCITVISIVIYPFQADALTSLSGSPQGGAGGAGLGAGPAAAPSHQKV